MATKARNPRVKADPSPNWDGAENWDGAKITSTFREAMRYYNLEFGAKDLKPKVIDWMGRNDYSKEAIARFKNTKDSRCGVTMGAIATCLLKGMPDVHKGFNNGRSTVAWLKNSIEKVLIEGKFDEIPQEATKKSTVDPSAIISIQDRIREQAVAMSEDIDYAIDGWIKNPESFDPKSFKITSLFRTKGVKAAQARYIKGFYQSNLDELLELAGGNADEQLREAYNKYSRKNVKKLIEFFEQLISACEQISAESKILKKPRKKKVKPAEELVKKIKFRISDDKLGITSIPPAQIIGSQGLIVYNVKTRKIGYYISKSSSGLAVKGASIIDFTDKSFQKTLRNPVQQFKEFKDLNTQKRFETWFQKSIKTAETKLNGRLNQDIIILKAWK